MIAFSRELLDEDESPSPVLINGPSIITSETNSEPVNRDSMVRNQELMAARVARQQSEFAMLQRALLSCGLIEDTTGSIEE